VIARTISDILSLDLLPTACAVQLTHRGASPIGAVLMQINHVLAAVIAITMLAHTAAAEETRVKKVGVILQGGPWYAVVAGLRDGLNQSGYLENKQYILDIRDTHGDLKAAEEAATNLEEQKVDLIYTAATSVSLAAKRATKHTPIVFYAGTDPVAVELVDSIPRPGGRLTGVYTRVTEVTGKRLELLREIVPNLHRVVTFYNPANRAALESVKEAREAAHGLGLELSERLVTSVDELRKALQGFRTGEGLSCSVGCDARRGGSLCY
jgi:putative tryptophan/tyrosine transport system substrate-binding protein